MSWGNPIGRAALLAAGLALGACQSTSIVESWKAPGTGPIHFDKVLALAAVQNQDIRRIAEDVLVSDMPGVEAVPSYRLIPTIDVDQREQVKALLHEKGFDGVVALSVVGAQEELSWAPVAQPGGSSFSGFYDYSYGSAYMLADTVVRVQVSVYSLAEDKLLWSGVSKTFNSNDTGVLVHEVAQAAGAELRRQGLRP